jgi:hypothetical protein
MAIMAEVAMTIDLAYDLLGWARIEYRQSGEALLDTPHLEADPSAGPLGLSLQTVLKRPANRLGQGLTGRSREGGRKTLEDVRHCTERSLASGAKMRPCKE